MPAPPAAKTSPKPGKPAAKGPAKASAKAPAKSPMVRAMEKLGLRRDIDLALHLPLRYEDETRITPLARARDGATVQIEATVVSSDVSFRPRRQLLVVVRDGDETCTLRFFNFYPSMHKLMAVGNTIRARGEVRGGFLGWTMVHPSVSAAGAPLPNALTPVYPTSAGLPQAYLRKAVAGALERVDLTETVAPELLPRTHDGQPMWTLRAALQFLHHPRPDVSLDTLEDHSHPAWQRLKVEELLAQQLSQLESRRARDRLRAPPLHAPAGGLRDRLLAALPFVLTDAQGRVCREIAADLGRTVPMHRLLQGDVGSGKTVVAALAAAICIAGGYQCALMAPTEILAEQHFRKLIGWLEPLGITTAWLTGSQKARERRDMLALIASGEAALVIGTHAVIQDKVVFHKLALAIIDEQHRFGVEQRGLLKEKGKGPHFLVMTATPIPRTLAMTVYGDLDVSVIDEMPPGRSPIQTRVIFESKRPQALDFMVQQIEKGRQAYIVYPLVEESEKIDLKNAVEEFDKLKAGFPKIRFDLLHGKMKADEKDAVMAKFRQGETQVLVSTTVIEVGVDVPNANIMIIEHSERFGLSQLHQLRGRVGRGTHKSFCILIMGYAVSEEGRQRTQFMEKTTDGFKIAEFDLEMRGPGEFLGTRQSGLPGFRLANLVRDLRWLQEAREAAFEVLAKDPSLRRAENKLLREQLMKEHGPAALAAIG
ncbi:MAG: ATP-dependent DNA helicase RecG [Rhodoferax sp.]|nr:ATP-dependent DNA helicase RecG [Rhodoferax sp.]